MEEQNVTAPAPLLDWNKIISETIIKHEELFVKAISASVQKEYKKAKINFGSAFTVYLTKALEKYSRIKTILYRNEPRFLYEFYEFNDIRGHDGEVIPCDSVDKLIEHSRFNIVLGDGGSGKSMLMRHFFLNALQASERIPIYVELRYLEEDTPLLDYIYKYLKNLGFDLEQIYFEYALKQGMFVLLLDGYDEIKCSLRNSFFKRIEEFCDNYSNNCYVLSSRRSDTFISWQRFSVYEILPLSKERALHMIEKLDYDSETKAKFSAKLDNELFDKHASFASNPLLLTILLMTFNQYAEIPEKLHVFYSYAFDTLYSMHDATKGGYKRELESKLTCDEFKAVFATLSFRTYLAGRYQFTKDELLQEITEAGKTIPNFDSQAYFMDIQVAVCLVCEDGLEYIFTHRSFQEYFTAVFLCSLDDVKQNYACRAVLKRCASNVITDKVFDMLKDMSEERFEKNYVIPLLEEIDKTCPAFSSDDQRYWYGLIENCFISSDIDTILTQSFHYVFPVFGREMRIEKGFALLCVKFTNSEYASFIVSLGHYYNNNSSIPAKRLPVEYWEKSYTAEDIWIDKKLRDHILFHTSLGKHIRFLNNFLVNLKDLRSKRDDDFSKMLEAIFEES